MRHSDVTGFSGAGVVADGVQWPDGSATLTWRGTYNTSTYAPGGAAQIATIHGHNGGSEIIWADPDQRADMARAIRDLCREWRDRATYYRETYCAHTRHGRRMLIMADAYELGADEIEAVVDSDPTGSAE